MFAYRLKKLGKWPKILSRKPSILLQTKTTRGNLLRRKSHSAASLTHHNVLIIRRPPKVGQNVDFNKTDIINIRAINRFLNPTANSVVLKQGSLSVPYGTDIFLILASYHAFTAKGHKKSYDANAKSSPSKTTVGKGRIERNRTASRQRDLPEYLKQGPLTPSCQTKLFDKLLGQKIRK